MRIPIAISLVVAILAPILLKNFVLLSFYAQRERIALEQCEERNVENSCCKGSCVLVKSLKKVADENNELPPPFKNKTEIVYLSEITEIVLPKSLLNNKFSPFYLELQSDFQARGICKPPSA